MLDRVKNALLTVSKSVYHYTGKGASAPYIVWAEDSRNDHYSENHHGEKAWMGTIDLFSKDENDPLRDEIEDALDKAGISWYLNSVQYEDDTKLIHTEWVFEVS